MAAANVSIAGLPARMENAMMGGAGNDSVFAACRDRPDMFYAYAAVDPLAPDAPDSIDGLRDAGARGIVVEAGIGEPAMYADDPRIDTEYEACLGAGLPVLLMGGGEAGPDVGYCAPVAIDRLAQRFPRLQFVNVHGGWPYVQESVGVAYLRPNVWMMPDCYFPGLPGESDFLLAIRTFLQDRFLFATGFPYCPVGEMVERYLRLGLDDDILEKVMAGNAARLFGV
jgi:predicted TIM-barrel fold metal-dependent hydrolase